MEELVEKGLVRTIGVSNFEIQHLEQILNPSLSSSPFSTSPFPPSSTSSFVLRIRPRVNQIETHPYLQCSELIDYCHRHSIAVMAYSPLGSPNNPWTSRRNLGLPSLLQDSTVEDIAERLRKTPSQILIRWALQRGNDR
jgi:diketogulonate reductase-like aldo/keto reductase